jgi:protein-disulfide isomerase
MMTTGEHPEPEDLMAWFDGELAGASETALRGHIAACPTCRIVADDLRDVSQQLAAWTVEPAGFQIPARPHPPISRAARWSIAGLVAAVLGAMLLALPQVRHLVCAPVACAPASQQVFSTPSETETTPFDTAWAAKPRLQVGVPADGAAVVIVEFIDWQCPSCEASYHAYKPVLDKYAQSLPGAIKYVVKDYPLSSRCNASVRREVHSAACEAAAAVRMARDRGRTSELVDWLFAHRDTLSPETVKAATRSILGITDFDAEYAVKMTDIGRDVAEAAALNIQFTPTFFINGVLANDANGRWMLAADFERAIESELKRAGRGQSTQNPH